MRRLLGMAIFAMVLACAFAARAEVNEYDPARRASLKAIFQFGSTATKQALNANTVTLISPAPSAAPMCNSAPTSLPCSTTETSCAYFRSSGAVLCRASPTSCSCKASIRESCDRYTSDYPERKGFAKDINKQFTYVTKLYNEEMQIIAPKSVQNLRDLEGKTVSVDLPNGSTFVTVLTVADRLGIKPNGSSISSSGLRWRN